MALRPRTEAQANRVRTPRVTLQARGLQTLRLPKLGACAGPSSVLLPREEVAMQGRGVTAGAEVHGCLGVTGGLQRKRDVLSAWSGDSVPVGHISFLRGGRPAE